MNLSRTTNQPRWNCATRRQVLGGTRANNFELSFNLTQTVNTVLFNPSWGNMVDTGKTVHKQRNKQSEEKSVSIVMVDRSTPGTPS